MLVPAKCVTPGWDSTNAVMYTPGGGPLPEGLYEIDRDGPLAGLKLGSTYVFEFDRPKKFDMSTIVTTPLNPNKGKPRKGYKCKGCGETFPNPYVLKIHKKTHEVAVEQAA